MRRRAFLPLACGIIGWPLVAGAQQSAKSYRVGYLSATTEAAGRRVLAAFTGGMRELGYDEKTLVIVSRYAEGKFDRLPDLAREILEQKPDCLLIPNTPPNLAMKAATSTVPIVMVAVGDPVGVGLVQSLARPGGNITGTTNIVPELSAKRLEILLELVPRASKVAVLLNPGDPLVALQMREVEAAAKKLGVDLDPILEIRGSKDLEPAFEAVAQAHADAVLRLVDPIGVSLGGLTAALAARYRLPVIYPSREPVDAGGLISFGMNSLEDYRHAAIFVHKVLQGARPAELPIERPTKLVLVVNMKAARDLDLTVPQALIIRADEVIE